MRLFLEKHAHKRTIYYGLSIVLFVNLIAFPFFPKLFSNTEIPIDKILDLQFGFSTDFVYQLFDLLGETRRKTYLFSTLFVDMPYLIVYGFTYSIFILFLLKKNGIYQKNNYLIFTPLLISFFDIIENIGTISLLINYPTKYPLICSIASYANQLKWLFALATIGLILFLLISKKRNKV